MKGRRLQGGTPGRAPIAGTAQLPTVAPVKRGATEVEATTVDGPDSYRQLPVVARSSMLAAGVVGIAVAVVMMLQSGLGAGPADVMLQAGASAFGVQHGTAGLIFSTALLVFAAVLRSGVRVGTVVAAVGIGPIINLVFKAGLVPEPASLAGSVLLFAAGLCLCALAVAFLIQSALGAGALELLTWKISSLTGVPAAVVRTLVESSFVLVGILGGATAGVGTFLFALSFGPLLAGSTFAVAHVFQLKKRPNRRRLLRSRMSRL